ncbi:PspA/IM30 family protein [Vibrio sp. ABG19]|uniref:PspA/IM30 family protein n=1 Tax=Vibrio sp. ABG19 TaxID=2817385 RepID=UPI00249F04F0|nr:PspA/IM30 family protein [Vibrio sp. ABG19]WGY46401.1 PspA/IM30 family protein [Vibrio sp. ABG19]
MAFSRLLTAFRGFLNDAAEAEADKHMVTEQRQNIRDAKKELDQMDLNIASTKGQRKLADNEVAELAQKIDNYESDVRNFAAQNKMDLATEIAGHIPQYRKQLEAAQGRRDILLSNETKMIAIAQDLKERVTAMEQELAQIESTAQMQKAQAATLNAVSGLDSKAKTALESMERIKQKQQQKAAQLEAAAEMADARNAPNDLDAKIALAKSEATSNAQSELERILGNP